MTSDQPSLSRSHWETVWGDRATEEVTWYQATPAVSLDLISQVATPTAAIIDVGGGCSLLIDHLLAAGYSDLSVLDISSAAIGRTRERVGREGNEVSWLVGDVTDWQPDREYDVWHDRAVLHFLIAEAARDRYVECLRSALGPAGHVILATFGPDGPEYCSGLPVRRYGRDDMIEALGEGFEPLNFVEEVHRAPSGATQEFLYGLFQFSSTREPAPL